MLLARTRFPVWLVIVYILALIAILAWPLTAFASVFAFDAPGSTEMPSTYVAVGIALCYPIIPVAGVLGSFLAYKRDRKTLAYVLAGLAVVPFTLMLLGVIISWLSTAGVLLGAKF